jgi:phytoene desaturase
MSAPRTVVVGGGMGGLLIAIRLRAAGHDVVVLERLDQFGGKVAEWRRDGWTFDLGPSLVTLPHLYDEVLHLAGTSLAKEMTMVRLSPQFRYTWTDGSTVDVHDDPHDTAAALDALSPGSGARYLRVLARARRIWEVSERTFLAGPMTGARQMFGRMSSPRDLLAIDPLRTLAAAARRDFDDPRLRQMLGRYATYSGSSPYRAPATLACIAAVEADHGAWYPIGGLTALRDAVVRAAQRCGVELHTGADVARIVDDGERVRGVRLADGTERAADHVVANVDAEHLYADLLPDRAAVRRVRAIPRSTSGVVVLVGARGTTGGIAHHNVWFSSDYRREFSEMDAGRMAGDPTIYACVSSVTDASQAPHGCENWFLLVNAPPGAAVDAAAYGPWLLERLAERGPDLRGRAEFVETITPHDLEARYRTRGGSIYGTSSNGRRAAFRRPSNAGARKGLHLVGGSSHPGGGLPLVAVSARIVADTILGSAESRPRR